MLSFMFSQATGLWILFIALADHIYFNSRALCTRKPEINLTKFQGQKIKCVLPASVDPYREKLCPRVASWMNRPWPAASVRTFKTLGVDLLDTDQILSYCIKDETRGV